MSTETPQISPIELFVKTRFDEWLAKGEKNVSLLLKYAPRNFGEIFLPERVHNLLENTLLRKDEGLRIFQFGSPGTGKTSAAKLGAIGHDVLYLSGSNDFNVAVMREKVYPFVSGHSVMGRQKDVIIDECENIADKIQDSFKIILDAAKKVNFWFNTNEPESVNSAIKSRTTHIPYNYVGLEVADQKRKYIEYAMMICKYEAIQYDAAGLREIYKLHFPDFRHLLVVIQQFIDSGDSITLNNVQKLAELGGAIIELYEAISDIKDAQKFYEAISSFKGKERECFLALGEPYFVWLNKKGLFEHTLRLAPIVANWGYKYQTAMIKFGTFFACCSELKSQFK
jgi:DNA polymerase III gamma/tau subunit